MNKNQYFNQILLPFSTRSMCGVSMFLDIYICLIPHPKECSKKNKHAKHQSVETNPSSWHSATRQWILHPQPWLQVPFDGNEWWIHNIYTPANFSKVPRKRNHLKRKCLSSNHYFFSGDMLVFLGVHARKLTYGDGWRFTPFSIGHHIFIHGGFSS